MKVSDLEGAQLDYWVARAEGVTTIIAVRENTGDKYPSCIEVDEKGSRIMWYHPSSSRGQGDHIIEREGISTKCCSDRSWYAYSEFFDATAASPDRLEAAMRAYVASKYGEEVPDEGK